MIESTQEQHDELRDSSSESVRAIDPTTNAKHALVRTEVYDRIKSNFSDDDRSWNRGAYAAALEVFARDGWNDPKMDVYDSLTTGEPL